MEVKEYTARALLRFLSRIDGVSVLKTDSAGIVFIRLNDGTTLSLGDLLETFDNE